MRRASLLLLSALACSPRMDTETIIALDGDEWAQEHIVDLDLHIRGGERGHLMDVETLSLQCARWPRMIALAPKDGEAMRGFEVEISARGLERTELAHALLRGDYHDGRIELFQFQLNEGCAANPCVAEAGDLPLASAVSLAPIEDREPPRVSLFFPPLGALALDEPVQISGAAFDRSGLASISPEGAVECARFHTSLTDVSDIATVKDAHGNEAPVPLQVRRAPGTLATGPFDLVADGAHDQAIVAMDDAVVAIDLTFGHSTPLLANLERTPRALARDSAGAFFMMQHDGIFAIADHAAIATSSTCELDGVFTWDAVRSRFLIAKTALKALEPSGSCTTLFDLAGLTGLTGDGAHDLAFDSSGDRAFLATDTKVYAYAFATGALTEVTCARPWVHPLALAFEVGALFVLDTDLYRDCVDIAHPGAIDPRAIAIDRGIAWIADPAIATLEGVHLDGGLGVALASDYMAGGGPRLTTPIDLVYSIARDQLLALADGPHALLAVSPNNGQRAILSGASPNEGDPFGALQYVAVDDEGRTAAVVYTRDGSRALITVDLQTGKRTTVASAQDGFAPVINFPEGVAIGPDRKIYVIESDRRAVVNIDLGTHERFDVTAYTRGGGPFFEQPRYLTFDRAKTRLLLSDRALATIFAIDIANGERTVLSKLDASVLAGAGELGALQASPDGSSLYVLAGSMLARLDLSSMSWRAISTSLRTPSSMSIDFARDVAFVSDVELNAVYAVELASGGTVVMSR